MRLRKLCNGSLRALAAAVALGALVLPVTGGAAPVDKVDSRARCPVCGMFVSRYEDWIVQVRLADGALLFFDGVKDMLVFRFDPQAYGRAGAVIDEMWVRDYYTLEWLAGEEAYYVAGSDVYGPMGREFIPFATREAADSFRADHGGEAVLTIDEIPKDMVESMRSGSRMRR